MSVTSQTFLMFVDLLVDILITPNRLLVHLLEHGISSRQSVAKKNHLRIDGG